MTITSTEVRKDYTGNASTTTFPFYGTVYAVTDIVAHVAGSLQTQGVHYDVVGTLPGPVSIVFKAAYIPALGASVIIECNIPETQATDLPAAGRYTEASVEQMSDKATRLVHQVRGRSILLPLGSPVAGPLQMPQLQPSKFIRVNPAGTALELVAASQADLVGILDDTIPSCTYAALPPAGTAGRMRLLADMDRGVWADSGAEWYPLANFINLKRFGAKGDGVTDDSLALREAVAVAEVLELPIYVPAGAYMLTDGTYVRGNVRFFGDGASSRLIQTGTAFPTAGAVLLYFQSPVDTTYTASGALSAGDSTLTLDSVTGLSVGDEIFLELGAARYDATQPFTAMFNRVAAIAGLDVTFSVPFPENVNGTDHTVLSFTKILDNVGVENISLEAADGAQPDQAVYFERCRNPVLRRIFMDHTGGLINAKSENAVFDEIYYKRAKIWGAYAASGNMIGGWGFRNFMIRNIYGMDIDKNGIYLEAEGRGVTIENFYWSVGAGYSSSGYGLWLGGGTSGYKVKNAHLNAPHPNYFGFLASEEAKGSAEDVYLYNGTSAEGLLKVLRGTLGWDRGAGTMEYYNHISRYSTKITLTPSATTTITLPSGIYKRIRVFASDITGITGFHFNHDGTSSGDFLGSLVTGSMVDLSVAALTSLGPDTAYPFNNDLGKTITIYTDGTVPSGAYLVVAAELYDIDDDAAEGMIQNAE